MAEQPIDESVMAGHGDYSAHSQPQHAAASVAYPDLERAAAEVPEPDGTTPVQILDMGCAGGHNEMEPMARAIDTLRGRGVTRPVEVVHTDLPENDFTPLFELLDGPDGYTARRPGVFPSVVGRTLFGPLVPDRRTHLGWSAITLHWLSSMPCLVPDAVFGNLTTGEAREALKGQAARDWELFLRERARELADGGQLVIVAGASGDDGRSGAEGLFELVGAELAAAVARGTLRRSEQERIFYPVWNRTLDEWLEPFASGEAATALELLDHHFDATDDRRTYPQYARDGDAAAFAAAYIEFVRPVLENALFRSLDPDRTEAERSAIKSEFYRGLQERMEAAPDVAVCDWLVVTLRVRRRTRG